MEKPPLIQPGSQTYAHSRRGTFGPIAVNNDGEILLLTTSHQVGQLKEGESIYLYPDIIPVGKLLYKSKINYYQSFNKKQNKKELLKSDKKKPFDQSFRVKGFGEYLPHVLKKPIYPVINQKLITYGAFSHIMKNIVLHDNAEINVIFDDGKKAKFCEQIKTGYMGTNGDSGSFVLTEDTFEPVGMLFAGNKMETYHNKLTEISKKINIFGFFCPISLPKESPSVLVQIVSSIIPDGYFYQKNNLYNKKVQQITEELGITEINKEKNGTYTVKYEDMIITSNPHKHGDEGSFLSKDNKVIGLAVAGSEKITCTIKIEKVLKALDLELIAFYKKESLAIIERSGYWNMRCIHCGATMIPNSKCHFCGGTKFFIT